MESEEKCPTNARGWALLELNTLLREKEAQWVYCLKDHSTHWVLTWTIFSSEE